MQWARYNTLFRTEGLGRFCYNALSNTLIELDDTHYALLDSYRQGDDPSGMEDNGFFGLLREKHFLVEAGEEENLLLVRQYNRQAACFSTATLGLTICPTLRCNFRCAYCFEASQRDGLSMSAETQERLVAWIKEHTGIRTLLVIWYGGEPLLAFDTICALTEKFLSLGLPRYQAALITNGYLLDRQKIARLNDLKISSIQITLDGPPAVHDTRRTLVGGGPTYARILENVSALMDSDYAGVCRIRVNLDKNNLEGFLELRSELLARFKGKKLSVYAGQVDVMNDQAYDRNNCMNDCEWDGFALEMAHRHWIAPSGGLHPESHRDGTCVAGMHQSFLVGPEGELYKCWEDVGRPAMVIGNIHAKDIITNPVLRAQYAIGLDAHRDPECRACTVLPLCGGSCPHRRLLVKHQGRAEVEYCSQYKTRLQDYLEAYIDTLRTLEMCSALLQPGDTAVTQRGYRVISPGADQPHSEAL